MTTDEPGQPETGPRPPEPEPWWAVAKSGTPVPGSEAAAQTDVNGPPGLLPRPAAEQPPTGANLPVPGARPPDGPGAPSWPADLPDGRPERTRPRTGTLVTFGVLIALIAALVGGLAGGYVGYRHASANGTGQVFNPGPAPAAAQNRPPASVAGIAARILPSVVMIKVDGGTGTGSGFIVSGGYIITNNHVVTLDGEVHGAKLQVVFNGGQTASATLVGTDPYSDIAVIRPHGISELRPVQLGNSDGVVVGDPVIAVGSPLGLAGTVTSGIVSALNRPVQAGDQTGNSSQAFIDAIQTDAPINPGNSGGPLVNSRGQVVGVNSAIATLGSGSIGDSGQSGSIGLGFAIPINQVRRVAAELVQTGKAVHPVIGAVIDMAFTGNGARIAKSGAKGQPAVIPGGPAAKAGLRPGDVIVAFDGKPVDSAEGLIVDIRVHRPGDKVRISYERGGSPHTATLTLGSASSS
jgi:putative serine protease PepD